MSGRIVSTLFTMSLALGMAMLVKVAAVREENPVTIDIYPQRISLNMIPPAEGIVLTENNDIPADVQVRLRAPESSWQRLSQNKFDARLDLSTYSEGLYDVPIQVLVSDEQVVVEETFPLEVSVQLEPLAAKEMPVAIRLTGEPPSGFVYLPPDPISVTVKGPATAVSKVERVEASLFLNNVKETVEREITRIPKSAGNETVNAITFEPIRQTISISVEQKFGYQTVRVKPQIDGEPASGYIISSFSAEPDQIVLRGLDNAPSSLETDEVDISGATEDVVKRVRLPLPPGFSIAEDEASEGILVTVKISAIPSGLIVERRLTVDGIGENLEWEADPDTVKISLTGPWAFIQNLKQDDITVIANLFELEPGVHSVELRVIKPEELEVVSIIPDVVEVTIQPRQRVRPTATPPLLPTPAITTTPPPPITVTDTTDILTDTLNLTNSSAITK